MTSFSSWTLLLLLALVMDKLWRVESMLSSLSSTQYRIVLKLGIDLDVFDAPSDNVRQLAMESGKKVEAIRAYRKQTGIGFKQGQAVIEKLDAQPPGAEGRGI
jgi:hypothetical protein